VHVGTTLQQEKGFSVIAQRSEALSKNCHTYSNNSSQ